MSYLLTTLVNLTKGLYPSGRAFRMPDLGVFRAFTEGYLRSMERAYNEGLSIFNGLIPDNDKFTAEDATFWERRLGLIVNNNTLLSDRKLAIARKMQHPGTNKSRQDALYVQAQLQLAGFDVYVFENRFDDGFGGFFTKTPEEFAVSNITAQVQHGQFQHGQQQHGATYQYKIVNHLNSALDATFDVGDNLRSTFFISGIVPGENAVIPESRELEFRDLVLKLKPKQTVCYAFISTTAPVESNLILEDESGIRLLEDGTNRELENSFE